MIKNLSFLFFFIGLYFNAFSQEATNENQTPEMAKSTHSKEVMTITTSRDGKSFFSGGWDYLINQIDQESGEVIKTFTGADATIISLNTSNDGKLLISGHDDGSLAIWEIETGKRLNKIRNHEGPVSGICFSTDMASKYFFSASEDGQIKKYDRSLLGKWIGTAEAGAPIHCMLMHPDGNQLFVGDDKGNISIYNPTDLTKIGELSPKHIGSVLSISISNDGKMLASGSSDKSINIYDLESKTKSKTLNGHTWKVLSVEFNNSQEYLISSSNDGSIKTWKVADGSLIQTYSLPKRKTFSAACFSSSSLKFIAGGQVNKTNPETIYFWNTGLQVGETVKFIPIMVKEKTPLKAKSTSKKSLLIKK